VTEKLERDGDPGARISAFVLARDEEDRIERCLRSIAWADERLVIVDAATRDATREKAAPLATEVIVRPWEGFAATRRFAVERTRHPWVLWVDADEAVDARLAEAIRAAVRSPNGRAAFRMARHPHYLGRRVRHGVWSGERVVRLFRRGSAQLDARAVHEGLIVDGAVGDLPGVLHHWSYRSLAHHGEKIGAWAGLWAEESLRRGRRAHAYDLLLRPPLRFLKGYVLKAGFLDGIVGIVVAFMDAVYVGTKYARLLEAQRARGKDGGEDHR
jgi:glycosyltransferase involved in cell wall biosynthesis